MDGKKGKGSSLHGPCGIRASCRKRHRYIVHRSVVDSGAPDYVKRCYALSGIYDMRDSMDGMYDDNFYFNNPVDYMANQSDPWFLHQYASCDIHLATGCGPWENSGPTYRVSEVLASRGIAHHLDDWGPKGGHEWPYWHHQMWEYVGAHY